MPEHAIRNPPCDKSVLNPRASSSCWYFVVYPESMHLPDLLNRIAEACYNYAYILHDKDVMEDGTPKKPHWHFAVWSDHTTTYKMVTDSLGISYAERPRKGCNLSTYLVYMTHEKQPNKYQYLRESVESNVPRETLDNMFDAPCSTDTKTLDLLDDIRCLSHNEISYYDFYALHPRFLYCPQALRDIMQQLY